MEACLVALKVKDLELSLHIIENLYGIYIWECQKELPRIASYSYQQAPVDRSLFVGTPRSCSSPKKQKMNGYYRSTP